MAKYKNQYEIRDNHALLLITKQNGDIVEVKISIESIEQCKTMHWHITKFGYVRTKSASHYILLHHFVLGIGNKDNKTNMVDHINGDTLDNRIENLRITNHIENCRNTHKRLGKDGYVEVIGVRQDKRCSNSWHSQIYLTQHKTSLSKQYKNKKLAIIRRLTWELIYFQEFAPQIELIKSEYPYLLGYLQIKDKMTFTDDMQTISDIGDFLISDPHCPCSLVKNDNTLCPCIACRNKQKCHCGMFVPIGIELDANKTTQND